MTNNELKTLAKIKQQQSNHIRHRWIRVGLGLLLMAIFVRPALIEIFAGSLTNHVIYFGIGYFCFFYGWLNWNGDPRLQLILDYFAKEHGDDMPTLGDERKIAAI